MMDSVKGLASTSKNYLKRTMDSTKTSNKALEEKQMWQEYELVKMLKKKEREKDGRYSAQERSPPRKRYPAGPMPWTQQLAKLESSIDGRWDHDGYRELYPEQFTEPSAEEHGPKRKKHHKEPRQSRDKSKRKKKHKSAHHESQKSPRRKRRRRHSSG